ncbi:mechanosensitive ion channel family protein [Tritonibacter horizontis]|uniref:Mechanosensitive channel MscK n=1 Tax=Tritonibacter horizontis TaxID=1768241 RepID=A0A132BT41_9RHOB|nr:mechanosensitive ion channel domain-containing protein [Tritonibacter horizontis]KUP91523.1 mechanosensitive channel MscK precursor [Tritonibacter horizontis]
MEQDVLPDFVIGTAQSLLRIAERYWDLVMTPGWRQYQVVIVLGLILAAISMRAATQARWETWARSREGWPKWRLRLLVQVLRRLTLIYFTLLSWAVYAVMREVTWPSRSYLIGAAAKLAAAWLAIALVSRFIANPSLRKFATWLMWGYATLAVFNLVDDAAAILDSVAFDIGNLHLSLLVVFKAVVLATAMLTIARAGAGLAERGLRRNEDLSPSMQVLAGKAVQVLLYGIAFTVVIRSIGFDLTGLAVLSGAVGVGIGFGLQKVVSNLVSGIIILMDRSIKPGDVISLGETFGWINALGARYVSVVTRDGKEYLIPNEDLITSQVVNWSHSNRFVRLDINFGTSYDDDPHKVRKVAIAAAMTVSRVLEQDGMRPVCHVVGFGDSSVDYILRFWISDPTGGLTNIRGNVFLALWDAFKAEGISIPFPQREVRLMNDPIAVQVAAEDPTQAQGGSAPKLD